MTHPTVLIVEPDFTGHRWRYAEWIAQACIEAGHPCTLATLAANAGHPLARRLADDAPAGLDLALLDPRHTATTGAGTDRVAYARFHRDFRHLYRAVAATRPVRSVIVPYVDYFLYALPFLGSPFDATPWIGITMRTSFHHPHTGVLAPNRPLANAVKGVLFHRARRTRGLRTLLSIDPTLGAWEAQTPERTGAAVRYLADPFPDSGASDPDTARQRLGWPVREAHLLVYGAISDRKGIRELCTALMRRPDGPRLVIAGEQDDTTRAFLAAVVPRLSPAPVVLDRFIDEATERDLFSACDAVWLGYRGHYGMSGVLVQAYRFGKPVLATADGLIGWFCSDGALGPVLANLDPDTIDIALDAVFAPSPSGQPPGFHVPAAHLLAQNTVPRFKATVRAALA